MTYCVTLQLRRFEKFIKLIMISLAQKSSVDKRNIVITETGKPAFKSTSRLLQDDSGFQSSHLVSIQCSCF